MAATSCASLEGLTSGSNEPPGGPDAAGTSDSGPDGVVTEDDAGVVAPRTDWESEAGVPPARTSLRVTEFRLIDLDTMKPVSGYDPMPLDLTIPGGVGNATIEAVVAGSGTVGGVLFRVDGALVQSENRVPYLITDDHGQSIDPWVPPERGVHLIAATPYTDLEREETAGTSLVMRVTVAPP